jgi:hypothetical protein
MAWSARGGGGPGRDRGQQAGLLHPGHLQHRRVDAAAQGEREVAGCAPPVGQGQYLVLPFAEPDARRHRHGDCPEPTPVVAARQGGENPYPARRLGQQSVRFGARLERKHALHRSRLRPVLLDRPVGQDEHGIGEDGPEQALQLARPHHRTPDEFAAHPAPGGGGRDERVVPPRFGQPVRTSVPLPRRRPGSHGAKVVTTDPAPADLVTLRQVLDRLNRM